jgi:signal transduction histidine kinase
MFCHPETRVRASTDVDQAVKNASTEPERRVEIVIGASLHDPYEVRHDDDFDWSPSNDRAMRQDPTCDPQWGQGELLYLHFKVKDSGKGMSEEERKNFVLRLSKGYARTHIEYADFDLGLCIAQQLTELHGGRLGVGSQAGIGSMSQLFNQQIVLLTYRR